MSRNVSVVSAKACNKLMRQQNKKEHFTPESLLLLRGFYRSNDVLISFMFPSSSRNVSL